MGSFRRPDLVPGLYDELVTLRAQARLAALSPELEPRCEPVGPNEDLVAPLTGLLTEAVALALGELRREPQRCLELAEAVLHLLNGPERTLGEPDELKLLPDRLRAIVARPAVALGAPLGSLHTSRLLVNAEGETLLEHLRSEFDSADRIDLLCSFVKLSGFERLRTALERHCETRGRRLRVLTTTYMRATDAAAIERLARLPGCEVKVSYDDSMTRLHAKAWVFHRASGYSTAYVGSSNLSHAAQTEGLEWNVRLTEQDQPAVLVQMAETFEQYWNDPYQFERYDGSAPHKLRLARALTPDEAPSVSLWIDLEPKDFQRPVLAELARARELGRHRNLLVAATGTGKTVMAALDYRALREAGTVDTLLFVAHRKEILVQARQTFRVALRSSTFGELLVDGQRPTVGRHVFASIDSLGSQDLARFSMVIVDEAHHSAARTWDELLRRVSPVELLGLTGTPERADGWSYAAHFPPPWVGNLRVWNAIPDALVPFRYYVLDVDELNLADVAWVNGRYAPEALAGKLVSAAELLVERAVEAVGRRVARPDTMRALAFCVNVAHARAVHGALVRRNYRAQVLTGETSSEERAEAQRALNEGRVQVLCVVDLYNEGVDVPNVNTLLFFRPTESATVFLQQLGRGLRRARDKAELVVFDLTGRQHAEFRFDRRLRGLLGHTPRQLREFVDRGFGRLPSGCHVEFGERSREQILAQLRRSIPDSLAGIRALLAEPAHAELSLADFLDETEVLLDDIYRPKASWHSLRASAGLPVPPLEPGEAAAMENVHKLLHIGRRRRDVGAMLIAGAWPEAEVDRRCARMIFAVLYGKELAADDAACRARFAAQAALRSELASLLPVLGDRNATLSPSAPPAPGIPLALHERYLGVELSVAFDQRTRTGSFRDYYTGVERTADGAFDLLLVTLEKSASTKEHLKYRDFTLHATRFHWQSKARTRRDTVEGQRLLQPWAQACTSLLLVRERSDDRPGVTMPFRYLGPVDPDGDHGERPITIEWALRHPMPPDLVRVGRIAG